MLPERLGVGAEKSIDNEFTIWTKPSPPTIPASATSEAPPVNASDSVLARDL